MPVRKVSNRGGNIVGRFPSLKMGRMIAFESLLERDFIYLLDYDVRVEWFEEQPLTIEYQHDGQALHYTPDFHCRRGGTAGAGRMQAGALCRHGGQSTQVCRRRATGAQHVAGNFGSSPINNSVRASACRTSND